MALSTIAGYGDSDSEESSPEDNQEVKRTFDSKSTDLIVSKRSKQTNKKEIVQISLPQVKSSDSSDEEDGEKTKKKKTPLIKSGTGLTSLLPQPKRFQGTKRSASLIPASIKKSKPTPVDANDSLDIDDDSSIQFFSNLDDSKPSLPLPNPIPLTPISSSHAFTSQTGLTGLTRTDSVIHNPPQQQQCSHYGTSGGAQTVSYSGYPSYPEPHAHQYSDSPNQPTDSSSQYTCTYQPAPPTEHPAVGNLGETLTVDEASFYRLAGGGSKRGKKKGLEAESLMKMRDISENEIKDAVAYQKYLTEEHSHTSGTVPEHLAYNPTQKRKHQITWLAAQAKEKEQQLKTFWSQAAATKKQTQMKYGF